MIPCAQHQDRYVKHKLGVSDMAQQQSECAHPAVSGKEAATKTTCIHDASNVMKRYQCSAYERVGQWRLVRSSPSSLLTQPAARVDSQLRSCTACVPAGGRKRRRLPTSWSRSTHRLTGCETGSHTVTCKRRHTRHTPHPARLAISQHVALKPVPGAQPFMLAPSVRHTQSARPRPLPPPEPSGSGCAASSPPRNASSPRPPRPRPRC